MPYGILSVEWVNEGYYQSDNASPRFGLGMEKKAKGIKGGLAMPE